jgi:hypothetical protein
MWIPEDFKTMIYIITYFFLSICTLVQVCCYTRASQMETLKVQKEIENLP